MKQDVVVRIAGDLPDEIGVFADSVANNGGRKLSIIAVHAFPDARACIAPDIIPYPDVLVMIRVARTKTPLGVPACCDIVKHHVKFHLHARAIAGERNPLERLINNGPRPRIPGLIRSNVCGELPPTRVNAARHRAMHIITECRCFN